MSDLPKEFFLNNLELSSILADIHPEIVKGYLGEYIAEERFGIAKRLIINDPKILETHDLLTKINFKPDEIAHIIAGVSVNEKRRINRSLQTLKNDLYNYFVNIEHEIDTNVARSKVNTFHYLIDRFSDHELSTIVEKIVNQDIPNNYDDENDWIRTLFFIINQGHSLVFSTILDKLKELKYYQTISDCFFHNSHLISTKTIDWILDLDGFTLDILENNVDYLKDQDPISLFDRLLKKGINPNRIIPLFVDNFYDRWDEFKQILESFLRSLSFDKLESYSSKIYYEILTGTFYYTEDPIEFDFPVNLIKEKTMEFFHPEQPSHNFFLLNSKKMWQNFRTFTPKLQRDIFTKILDVHYIGLKDFAKYQPHLFKDYIDEFLNKDEREIYNQRDYMQVLIAFIDSIDDINNENNEKLKDRIFKKCKDFKNSRSKSTFYYKLNRFRDAIHSLRQIIESKIEIELQLSYYLDYLALTFEQYVNEMVDRNLMKFEKILRSLSDKIENSNISHRRKVDIKVKFNYLKGRLFQVKSMTQRNTDNIVFMKLLNQSNLYFDKVTNTPNILPKIRSSIEQLKTINIRLEESDRIENLRLDDLNIIRQDTESKYPSIIPPLFSRLKPKYPYATLYYKGYDSTDPLIVYQWDDKAEPTQYFKPVDISNNEKERFILEINAYDGDNQNDLELWVQDVPLRQKRNGPWSFFVNQNNQKLKAEFTISSQAELSSNEEEGYILRIKTRTMDLLRSNDFKFLIDTKLSPNLRKNPVINELNVIIDHLRKNIEFLRLIRNSQTERRKENIYNNLVRVLLEQSLKHKNIHIDREDPVDAGRADFCVYSGDSKVITIIEALRNRSELKHHIKKLIDKYNPRAYEFLILLVYSEEEEIDQFWVTYTEKIEKIRREEDLTEFEIGRIIDITGEISIYFILNFLKCFKSSFNFRSIKSLYFQSIFIVFFFGCISHIISFHIVTCLPIMFGFGIVFIENKTYSKFPISDFASILFRIEICSRLASGMSNRLIA
ncbi:MAG: hypothetical protein GF364_02620 [Candidatus Lokiarchaeota archaeon]|nr:hypothetical protein [Candidatus Lokiarchaeota archaeon]